MRPSGRTGIYQLIAFSAALGAVNVACYEAPFPIAEPGEVVLDDDVLAKWRCLPSDAGADVEAASMTVAPPVRGMHAITFKAAGEEAEDYEAHVSVVGGRKIVNVRGLRGDVKKWTFMRYSILRKGVLHVEVLSDDAVPRQSSPSGLRSTMEKLSKSGAGYEDVCTCVRVSEQ